MITGMQLYRNSHEYASHSSSKWPHGHYELYAVPFKCQCGWNSGWSLLFFRFQLVCLLEVGSLFSNYFLGLICDVRKKVQ